MSSNFTSIEIAKRIYRKKATVQVQKKPRKFFSQKMLLLEIWGYDPSICRSLGIAYVGRTKYNGIPVSLYELDLGADINVKQCFCRDEDTCPPKGTFDLFRCGGVSGTYFFRNSICNSIVK